MGLCSAGSTTTEDASVLTSGECPKKRPVSGPEGLRVAQASAPQVRASPKPNTEAPREPAHKGGVDVDVASWMDEELAILDWEEKVEKAHAAGVDAFDTYIAGIREQYVDFLNNQEAKGASNAKAACSDRKVQKDTSPR